MSSPTARPEHTCPSGEPSQDCPACNYQVERFPALMMGFLDLVSGHSPDDEAEHQVQEIHEELHELRLVSAAWFHLASIATQLANKPVTIDRERMWGHLPPEDRQLAEPLLDLCDELLTAAATDDRNRLALVAREILAKPRQLHSIVYLSLAEAAQNGILDEMSLWQQVAHRALLRDVWGAIGHPYEILLGARICGALLDQNMDVFHMLTTRATLTQTIPTITLLWARACAKNLVESSARYAILRITPDGTFDAMLNADADLGQADNVQERAFLVAERMIRAIATKDSELGATVPQALQGDAELVKYLVAAMANFYAQFLHALHHQSVAEHKARCGHHDRESHSEGHQG